MAKNFVLLTKNDYLCTRYEASFKPMGRRLKKLKRIRIHREGNDTLLWGAIAIVAVAAILFYSFDSYIPFYIFAVVFGLCYAVVVNFY